MIAGDIDFSHLKLKGLYQSLLISSQAKGLY